MKVLLTGGGTAGHINPAIAIAQSIKGKFPGAKVLFVGSENSMESQLVPKAGFEFAAINVRGFRRSLAFKNILRNIGTVKLAAQSTFRAKKIIKGFAPDIVIGTGGYTSWPVIRAAQKMGIPTLIHEQNAFPGVANKMLAKNATCVMVAVPEAERFFPQSKRVEVTGNPVRSEIIFATKEKAREKMGFDGRPVIFSYGGSLGASPINKAVAEMIRELSREEKYQFVHGAGRSGYEKMLGLLKNLGVDLERHPEIRILPYIDNMADYMAAADLVICRAGALTISELQVQGKASILIPSPYVAENHQYHNAMALAKRGGAVVIEEKDLTGSGLAQKVKELVSSPEKLKEIGKNARKGAIYDSGDRICAIVEDVLKAKK